MNELQASYHSTQSNNKMAMTKLDEFSQIAEKTKQSKINKNPKRAVKDHLYAPQPIINNKNVLYGS